ncbi:MAG: single-stranded-DNA-specific exonuclease RecJ [Lachnospiraceae bacterium]|nr:single-stranded-DNA-specific exonuclease RecJ [Lachnospiraceae bacterium]
MSKWMVAAKKADFEQIAARYGISPVTARLIRNRDFVTEEEISRFLSADLAAMHDPALLTDAVKTARILAGKIRQKKRIRVVGDYDADGVTATALLVRGLLFLGACVDYRIPHRIRDGYGINDAIVEEAAADGIDTILTCDNGIAAATQTRLAREKGLTVLITDHHDIPFDEETGAHILPEADAVVDPKRDASCPFQGICGAVVAHKVLSLAFSEMRREDEEAKKLLYDLTLLSAVGTVCDVMELRDENRVLVKDALPRMKESPITGLRALIDATGLAGREITVYHLGFVIGPCINATGRLDTAVHGVELLLTEDMGEALQLATELKELNESRRNMTAVYVEEAKKAIGPVSDKVLVVYLPEAHESVAGIVAGRLREACNRPSIVLTKSADGGVKGSGRSVPAYDMFRALSGVGDLFTRFGGHPMAAGLSMAGESDVDVLRRRLNEACTLTEEDFTETLHLDMELPPSYVTTDLIEEWERVLAPFGNGNERPLFAARDIRLLSARTLGRDGRVGKYAVSDAQGKRHEMILFRDRERFDAFLTEHFGDTAVRALYGDVAASADRHAPEHLRAAPGRTDLDVPDMRIKIAYYPDINEYRGQRTVQLVLEDYLI